MELVRVAIFSYAGDAAVFGSILSAEKIDYLLNNYKGTIILPESGITLSIRKEDEQKVLQLVKIAGFENNLIH